MHIDASHSVARTIFIDTAAVRPTQFNLSDADGELLYRSGRQAAEKFLDGNQTNPAWDFDRYIAAYRS